jgi:hypothetical protein
MVKAMTHTVTVGLPEEIYNRLEQSARITNTPVEELIIQSVKAGMPPSVNDLPTQYRQECLALERLGNNELRQVAESTLSAARQRRYSALLRKNQAGVLTERERKQLSTLGAEARALTLRKAYAYALLRWRGCRIPTRAELTQPE